MKVSYPFKLIEGRNLYYISFSFKAEFHKFYDAQWGTMYSDVLYTLGDRFQSLRFKSSKKECELIPIEYYFIDFFQNIEEKENFENSKRSLEEKERYKISCKPMDIKENALINRQMNLVLLDSFNDTHFIFGIGVMDFDKRKINLDIFNNYHIKLMSFCERSEE